MIGTPIMQIDLTVSAPVETRMIGGQNRRCIPITGGSVSGIFQGIVENGGADWQTVLPDGSLDIDARYILRLAEGTVEVESRGLRTGPPEVLARLGAGETVDPALYYFRTAMRFRTAASSLLLLNHILAISVGERLPETVRLTVYEVA
jgi:Protein of unknown function (DUF3237)